MILHFHGAAGEVTGSKHIAEINGKKILLDCGMFQGKREESDRKNRSFGFNPKEIDAVVLSHAHLDHTGLIPLLVQQGFSGEIFMTRATDEIARLMLMDSAHIQEADSQFYTKHKDIASPRIPREPLYTEEDATNSFSHFRPKPYREAFEVLPGITCTFLDAGHILGSSVVVLEFLENGEKKRLIFTGDLGRKGKNIIKDPEIPDWGTYLLTESTYGNKTHEKVSGLREKLAEVVEKTARRGGKILIPSFALERTQEILYDLHVLFRAKKIPDLPIFVDSPLTVNVTEVFSRHQEDYDSETARDFFHDEDGNPFTFGKVRYTKSAEESKALNSIKEPCIIISSSGMCEAGRVRHHLRNMVENPKNTILIVGYQAENTLGRRIVERRPCIKLFGEMRKLRAEVEVLNGYSGHIDAPELLEFIAGIQKLTHVFVIHGEAEASGGLAKALRKLHRGFTVEIPESGESINPEEITYEGE